LLLLLLLSGQSQHLQVSKAITVFKAVEIHQLDKRGVAGISVCRIDHRRHVPGTAAAATSSARAFNTAHGAMPINLNNG
jgi:hypothetical protein